MNRFASWIFLLVSFTQTLKAEMGVPIQLRLRAPDLSYPTVSGTTIKARVLSNSGCILREELFTNQSLTEGQVSIVLGNGVQGVNDPGLMLVNVFDNFNPKMNLLCVDANDNVTSSGQTYNPVQGEGRILRITTNINSDDILADLTIRATPYAFQAESIGGITASNLITQKSGTELNQNNLESLLADSTRFNNLLTTAINGSSSVSTTLTGDVIGSLSANSVIKIQGVNVSFSGLATNNILQYNGSQIINRNIPSCSLTDYLTFDGSAWTCQPISGGSIATINVTAPISSTGGTSPNLSISQASSATDGYLLSSDWNKFNNKLEATSSAVIATLGYTPASSTVFSGDVSGNASSTSVDRIKGVSVTVTGLANNNILQYNGANYVNRSIPTCALNQYLTFNGSSWSCATDSGSAGVVASINVNAPLNSSGGANPTVSISQSNASTDGYLSSADWVLFNSKLTESVFNSYVASAQCTTMQSMYWNSVSSQFLCQNLNVGTTANSLAAGDDSRIVNALQTSSVFAGDVSGNYNSISVDKIKGSNISATVPTTGQLLVFNGTAWAPLDDPVRTTRKTADQAFTSTTPAVNTGLSFSVVAGNTYRFSFSIIFSSAAVGTGAEFGLTVPTGTLSAIAIIPTAADGTAGAFHGSITTSGDSVTATGVQAANTNYFARVEGIFVATATGTLQLTTGTETAGTAITVRAGSHGEIRLIP